MSTADAENLVRFVMNSRQGERNERLFWAALRCGAEGGSGETLIAAAMALGRNTVRSGLARCRQGHS